jgi:hypothetical protein
LDFQTVEGGSICAGEKSVTIRHSDAEDWEMRQKYAEKLKDSGWTRNTTINTSPDSFIVEKNKKYINLAFRKCPVEGTSPSTWWSCTDVLIDELPSFSRHDAQK